MTTLVHHMRPAGASFGLRIMCEGGGASFKTPRSVEFVTELPRTPAGKLLRRRLRDERQRA